MIGTATDGVTPDLPRNDKGSAILVEPRNDENLIIAQIHLSFLRLHNSLVDQGMSFDEARQTVVGAYRDVVLNDYLPQIVGQKAVKQALRRPQRRVLPAGVQDAPMTPVEFSTAAFRFGHSQFGTPTPSTMRRAACQCSRSTSPTCAVAVDSQPIQDPTKNFVIDFNNFFSELPRDSEEALR